MREYVEERLAGLAQRFGGGWDRAIATSATASAVVCAVNRVPRARREQADRMRASTAQVRRLFARLAELDMAGRRKVTGIGPSRAEIIVPGAGVLLQILETFRLPSVYYSLAGVRDGIIADLAARGVGSELSRLSREQRRDVEQMSRKYGVAARPRAQGGGDGPGVVFGACSRCTTSRTPAASCSRPRLTCTTWGTTSAIPATTNIPTTWWPIPIFPVSPAGSGNSSPTCAATTGRRCRPPLTRLSRTFRPRTKRY